MIKCKEDLINTKVDGRDKELCRLFQELAFSFGFTWCGFNDKTVRYPSDDYFVIFCDDEEVSWEREEYTKHHSFTELTISDLKPRTRTEYEKVTESIFDLRDEFERGELYAERKNKEKYYQVNTEQWLVSAINNNNVYRKVEKEIDEKQEFIDLAIAKIDHTNSDDPGYYADWFEQLYDSGCRFQD